MYKIVSSVFGFLMLAFSLSPSVAAAPCVMSANGVLDCRASPWPVNLQLDNLEDGTGVTLVPLPHRQHQSIVKFYNVKAFIGTRFDDQIMVGRGTISFILSGGRDYYMVDTSKQGDISFKVYALPGTQSAIGQHVIALKGYSPDTAIAERVGLDAVIKPNPEKGLVGPTIHLPLERFYDPYKPHVQPYLPAGCDKKNLCIKPAEIAHQFQMEYTPLDPKSIQVPQAP